MAVGRAWVVQVTSNKENPVAYNLGLDGQCADAGQPSLTLPFANQIDTGKWTPKLGSG